MNQVDVVELIGNRLTQIDMKIAGLSPSDPKAVELTDLRLRLDKQQRLLVKQVFDDNTAQFQQAADDLAEVNASIADSIQDIEQIALVIDDVTRFLNSVTNLVTTASKFV